MTALQSRNYYAMLGVPRNASKEQIRDAYKELARIYHPDSHHYDEILQSAGVHAGESETFKYITDAYNTLSNDKTRAEYDKVIPSELPTWGEPTLEDWQTESIKKDKPAEVETRYMSSAYGAFGVVRENTGTYQRSAFDDDQTRNVRAVSEMIKVRRGFWYRIRWLFFLEK